MTRRRVRKRKLVYAVVGPAPHLLVYAAVPIAIGRRGRRHGWSNGRPGALNWLGSIPVALGAGILGWAIASHYRAAPDEAELAVVPTYLARGGAYARTRNPMYLGGATMQAGWSIVFGSVPLAAITAGYVSAMSAVAVPFEERLLRRKFGASYDRYRQSVPRWLPRLTRRAG